MHLMYAIIVHFKLEYVQTIPNRPISLHCSTPSKVAGYVHIITISVDTNDGGHSNDLGIR